jgi:hypothetical protein
MRSAGSIIGQTIAELDGEDSGDGGDRSSLEVWSMALWCESSQNLNSSGETPCRSDPIRGLAWSN